MGALGPTGPLRVYAIDLAAPGSVRTWSWNFEFGLSWLGLTPDGNHVLSGGHDGELEVCSLTRDGRRKVLPGHKAAVRDIAFSPNHRRFATASADGYLSLWDAQTWARLAVVRAHSHSIYSLAFHPAGDRLVTGGMGPTLGVWSAHDLRELGAVPLPKPVDVNRLHFFDEDRLLAWTGHWVPSIHSQVIVLRAPPFHELE